MELGKKPAEHLFQGRTITAQTKWWIDNTPGDWEVTLNRFYCVHNVALDRECAECADSA